MGTLNVLIRSLVRIYYEANIGFFLIVLYLSFGVLQANEHIALATSIATSLPLTLLTLLLWGVYYLKSFGFIYKTLNTNQYKFIRELIKHSKSKQFIWLFAVHFVIGLPAWLYGGFISTFNFQIGAYINLVLMLGFLLMVNTAIVVATILLLKKPRRETQPGLWTKLIAKKISFPYYIWYIKHLFLHEPMLVFLSKSGSLIVLLGSYYLFKTDVYDWRLLAVGTLFSFSLNSMLIYNYYEFNLKNSWIFNLPRTQSQILLYTLLSIFIIFIPEMVLILIKQPTSLTIIDSVGLVIFNIALAYSLLNSLLLNPLAKDSYGKRIFYFLIALLFSIMYGIPLLITSLILVGFGIWVMSKYYKHILK